MALKTLNGVEKLGEFSVLEIVNGEPARHLPEDDCFVVVDHKHNAITFKIQNGPVKEGGKNGCQVDTMIHAAAKIIEGLNVPPHNSHENDKVLYHLREALNWLNFRRMDREKRKVEGTSAA